MSKRVYEIAREKSLNSKEVIKRLRDAGVEVNHHSATIEDPIYEQVFGDGQNGQADTETTPAEPAGATVEDVQNGQSEASPVSTPAAAEQQEPTREARKGGRKRRRVVIDASATNRGSTRTVAAPAAPREEPQTALVEEPARERAVRIGPGATVKYLALP